MREQWRLLDTGYNDAYLNMAVDEAILQAMKIDSLPVLRFYDWSQAAISIGYSQKVDEVLKSELCNQDNVIIIRRPTGGGVVFHGIDLTYSVIFPQKKIDNIHSIYLQLQEYLIAALANLGITAGQHPQKESAAGYCYVSPNIGDIMVGGKKLAGMAIRRIKNRILCQGYIYYDNAAGMAKYVSDERMSRLLQERAVYLQAICQKDKQAVKEAIVSKWPGEMYMSSLTLSEQEMAERLTETKYSLKEWNCRR